MKKISYANGFSETWSKQNCYFVVGKCQHLYTGNPKWTGNYASTVTKKGNDFELEMTRKGRDEGFKRTYRRGKFGVVSYEKRGNYWLKLEKIR